MPINIPKPLFYFSLVGTVSGGGLLLRDYLTSAKIEGEKEKDKVEAVPVEDLDGKVVIVTGANTGIGRETAFELAKRKAKVIMACRNIEKCEEAREDIVLKTLNKFVYCRKCDLASQKSVRQFVERFKKEHDRLDILINNASVMRCPNSKTEDGIETHLAVNHMSHFLLTNLLLDVLKKSKPSRIVNVSCQAYVLARLNKEDLNSEKSYDASDAYTQSKLATVLFTMELHKKLRETGVTANVVNPGTTRSQLDRNMTSLANSISHFFMKPILFFFERTPKQAAEAVVHVSTSPTLNKVSGKYFEICDPQEPTRLGKDPRLAKWLWLTSEKWTKLEPAVVET